MQDFCENILLRDSFLEIALRYGHTRSFPRLAFWKYVAKFVKREIKEKKYHVTNKNITKRKFITYRHLFKRNQNFREISWKLGTTLSLYFVMFGNKLGCFRNFCLIKLEVEIVTSPCITFGIKDTFSLSGLEISWGILLDIPDSLLDIYGNCTEINIYP